MAQIPLPVQEGVRDLIGDLLSKGCAVDASDEPLPLSPDTPSIIATYVDEDGAVAGVSIADLEFACRCGSALVMMPLSVADEAIAEGQFEGDMADCYREVVNVLSRVLNSTDTPRVTLGEVYRSGQLLPGPVHTMIRTSPRRKDFTVAIDEYGEGRLSMVARG